MRILRAASPTVWRMRLSERGDAGCVMSGVVTRIGGMVVMLAVVKFDAPCAWVAGRCGI